METKLHPRNGHHPAALHSRLDASTDDTQQSMNGFPILDRRERRIVAATSLVATAAVIGAVWLAFADDGRTPWFQADSRMAAQLVRCEALPADNRRHRCLREVAAVAAEQTRAQVASARTRLQPAVAPR